MRPTYDSVTGNGFEIATVATDDGSVRLAVSGEFDLATSPRLEEEIDRLDDSTDAVVLDLGRVSFIDSTGLQALWRARQRLADANRKLLLTEPSSAVTRLLRLTKLTKVFEFVDGPGSPS